MNDYTLRPKKDTPHLMMTLHIRDFLRISTIPFFYSNESQDSLRNFIITHKIKTEI